MFIFIGNAEQGILKNLKSGTISKVKVLLIGNKVFAEPFEEVSAYTTFFDTVSNSKIVFYLMCEFLIFNEDRKSRSAR